ncbi:MAG: hypothetical protein ACU83U_08530, partial [Gammaproteobacteria bacterium]
VAVAGCMHVDNDSRCRYVLLHSELLGFIVSMTRSKGCDEAQGNEGNQRFLRSSQSFDRNSPRPGPLYFNILNCKTIGFMPRIASSGLLADRIQKIVVPYRHTMPFISETNIARSTAMATLLSSLMGFKANGCFRKF